MSDTMNDAPLLRRADAIVSRIEDFLTGIAAFVIMFIMFFATAQVISRKAFNYPLWGFIDIIEIVMVSFAFLAIAYCQRLGGHIRMELLVRRLNGRALWIAEFLGVLAALIIIFWLMLFGWDFFIRAFELGDSTIDRDLPIWPAKLVIPIAFFVLNLRLIIQLFAYIRLIKNPDAEPIAIPVIEEFEELAQQEIDGAFGDDASDTTSTRGAN